MKIGTINVDNAAACAAICAGLARENIRFTAAQFGDGWVITITGY